MDTLKDLIDAVILVAEIALVVRMVILSIQSANEEDQQAAQYKRQKRTVLKAIIIIACVYDIVKLAEGYFK